MHKECNSDAEKIGQSNFAEDPKSIFLNGSSLQKEVTMRKWPSIHLTRRQGHIFPTADGTSKSKNSAPVTMQVMGTFGKRAREQG